jgi:hypothetical protein
LQIIEPSRLAENCMAIGTTAHATPVSHFKHADRSYVDHARGQDWTTPVEKFTVGQ